jgi:hypothetical protein
MISNRRLTTTTVDHTSSGSHGTHVALRGADCYDRSQASLRDLRGSAGISQRIKLVGTHE